MDAITHGRGLIQCATNSTAESLSVPVYAFDSVKAMVVSIASGTVDAGDCTRQCMPAALQLLHGDCQCGRKPFPAALSLLLTVSVKGSL